MIVYLDIGIFNSNLSLYNNDSSITIGNYKVEPWSTHLDEEFEFLLSIDDLKENITKYCQEIFCDIDQDFGRIRLLGNKFDIEESNLLYMKMKYPTSYDYLVKIN